MRLRNYIATILCAIAWCTLALALVMIVEGQANGQAYWRGRNYSGPVCNSRYCSMCNSIRQQLAQPVQATEWIEVKPEGKSTKNTIDVSALNPPVPPAPTKDTKFVESKEDPGQKPLQDDAITDALASLRLTSGDVFCDIGCGDGRILITAVRRYRCRAVGIEIDPEMAKKARLNVAKAVNDGKIDPGYIIIHTGDAKNFNPQKHGVTAAIAYLFPESLNRLKTTLEKIPRLSIPFHQIEGLSYIENYRQNYIYINPNYQQLGLATKQ